MFRDNLKFKIDCKGMIIKELAALTGVSKRTIDTYVDSRAVIPNAEVAVRLAKALDTSVEYLVTGEEGAQAASSSDREREEYRRYQKIIAHLNKLPGDVLEVVSVILGELAKRYEKA